MRLGHADVAPMVMRYQSGARITDLARQFRVHRATVQRLHNVRAFSFDVARQLREHVRADADSLLRRRARTAVDIEHVPVWPHLRRSISTECSYRSAEATGADERLLVPARVRPVGGLEVDLMNRLVGAWVHAICFHVAVEPLVLQNQRRPEESAYRSPREPAFGWVDPPGLR